MRGREIPRLYAFYPADGSGTLLVSHAVCLGNGFSGGSGIGDDTGPVSARHRQFFPRKPPRRGDSLVPLGLGDLSDVPDFLHIFPKLIQLTQTLSNKQE